MGKLENQVALTFKGAIIPENILGMLYICRYDFKEKTIEVVNEIGFENGFDALQAYSNTRNAESQLAIGKDRAAFIKDLEKLHANLNNPEWVKELSDYL